MIEVEFEEPNIEVCDCCGNKTIKLTRFVYNNDSAFAIYYAKFTEGHDKSVTGIISIGNWGTDDESNNRFAFPFRIWTNENTYQVGLIDKADSYWQQPLLGIILDRDEALNHPWIKDVFHITDHIVTDDGAIIEFLSQS